jgi:hypothetical protein
MGRAKGIDDFDWWEGKREMDLFAGLHGVVGQRGYECVFWNGAL